MVRHRGGFAAPIISSRAQPILNNNGNILQDSRPDDSDTEMICPDFSCAPAGGRVVVARHFMQEHTEARQYAR